MKTLQPSGRVGLRDLYYGGGGAGKTTAWLSIAKACPHIRFIAVNAENSPRIEHLLDTEFQDVLARDQVEIIDVDAEDWEQWVAKTREAVAKVDRTGCLVVDPMKTWGAVQDAELEQIGVGRDTFYEMLASKTDGNPINYAKAKYHHSRGWWRPLRGVPKTAHIILIAQTTRFGKDDGADLKALYGPAGCKPEGQVIIGHWPNTIIYFEPGRHGPRGTILKGSGKAYNAWDKEPMRKGHFARMYLQGLCGWKPAEIEEAA